MTFVSQLPTLLPLLADPTTPDTAHELWCRITTFDWTKCIPVLLSELETGVADVKQLVLDVLLQEVEHSGVDLVQRLVPRIVSLLSNDDRLVRKSAIQAVRDLHLADAIEPLRKIICDDEPLNTTESLGVLIELDRTLLGDLIQFMQDRSH